MYLYLHCVVFGGGEDKSELAWRGKSDNVTAGQGGPIFRLTGVSYNFIYSKLSEYICISVYLFICISVSLGSEACGYT